MTEFKRDTAIIEEGAEAAAGPGAERSPEMVRREFLKRFGVYAAGSAVGLYVLMSGKKSSAADPPADSGLN
jgi:hypothetical protein